MSRHRLGVRGIHFSMRKFVFFLFWKLKKKIFKKLIRRWQYSRGHIGRVKDGELLSSVNAPAPMRHILLFNYRNDQNQIRIYTDEIKATPSALSLSKTILRVNYFFDFSKLKKKVWETLKKNLEKFETNWKIKTLKLRTNGPMIEVHERQNLPGADNWAIWQGSGRRNKRFSRGSVTLL